jgi:ABC-type transport system involved in cytochrome bd biosynthesis fused ATPase/permease subunit
LTPYEEQVAVGDNLLIASDNLRQNIHLYVRDAQNLGAWLQQTTLSRHVNNADGNWVRVPLAVAWP